MLRLKRAGRLTACLLLLCMVVSLIPRPVSALPANKLPIDPSGQQPAEPAGRTVSLVHYSAHYGSTIIGCLEDGTKVTVLGQTYEFYRIDCFDMKGYIAKTQVAQNEKGEYIVRCVSGSSETQTLATHTAEASLSLKGDIRTFSMKYIGVPYVTGGSSPRGFDCSGFTQYVFNNLGFSIQRTVATQLQSGVIISKDDLQCGDLIFFQNTTGWGHFASHVGIYIGNGQMIHAGSRGITVVSLELAYFTYHYMCARRLVLSDISQETVIPAIGINQNINSSYWRETSQTENGLGNSFAPALASA